MNKSKTVLMKNTFWWRGRNTLPYIRMKFRAFESNSLGLQYYLFTLGHACCAKIYSYFWRFHSGVFISMRSSGKCVQLVMRLVSNSLLKFSYLILELTIFLLSRCELLVYRQCRRAELQQLLVHCNLQLTQFARISEIDSRSDEFRCPSDGCNCCRDRSDIHAVSPKRNGHNSVADHTTSLRFVEGK